MMSSRPTRAGRHRDVKSCLIIAPRAIDAVADVLVNQIAQIAGIEDDAGHENVPLFPLLPIHFRVRLIRFHGAGQSGLRFIDPSIDLLAQFRQRGVQLGDEMQSMLNAGRRFVAAAVAQIVLVQLQFLAGSLDRFLRGRGRLFLGLGRIVASVFGQRRQIPFAGRFHLFLAGGTCRFRGFVPVAHLAFEQRVDVADGSLEVLGQTQLRGHNAQAVHVEVVRPNAANGAAQQQDHSRYDQAQTEHQFVANAPSRGHARTLLRSRRRAEIASPQRPCSRNPATFGWHYPAHEARGLYQKRHGKWSPTFADGGEQGYDWQER